MDIKRIGDRHMRTLRDIYGAALPLDAARASLYLAMQEVADCLASAHESYVTAMRSELSAVNAHLTDNGVIFDRLQGLEDVLLAWLDEHGRDLVELPADYDQHLAQVVVELLNQQRATIAAQQQALLAQQEAISRLQQRPAVERLAHQAISAINTSQPNGTAITITDPSVPADWTHGEALYVELHRLAQDGVGPSKFRWDDERAEGMDNAATIVARTGSRWFTLLKTAGLKPPTGRPASTGASTDEVAPNGDATFR